MSLGTDKLLWQLKETSSRTSVCNLYLGGAVHADDVLAIASSATVAEEQGRIMIIHWRKKQGGWRGHLQRGATPLICLHKPYTLKCLYTLATGMIKDNT